MLHSVQILEGSSVDLWGKTKVSHQLTQPASKVLIVYSMINFMLIMTLCYNGEQTKFLERNQFLVGHPLAP